MRMNEHLLSECEEFFELIVNEEKNPSLTKAIHSLREFLEKDVDGWTSFDDEKLARAVQCRLMEIWGQIPRAEKIESADLKDYYDEIIYHLESVTGCETDGPTEYAEGLFDLDSRSRHITDSQEFMYEEDDE